MTDFRTWLSETTGVDADVALDVIDALDKAFPRLYLHQDIKERWDETYADDEDLRGDYLRDQRIDDELTAHFRDAARECNREIEG